MVSDEVRLFDITISNITMHSAINKIIDLVRRNEKGYVVTPNVDHIVKLREDALLKKIYENATLILADGMPLIWSARLLGKPIVEKVSGSDLFVQFAPYAAKHGIKLFFLGALEGVAEQAKENLCKLYADLQVVGTYSPPFGFDKNETENQKIIERVNATGAQVLFVGVGAPKQEYWIYNNMSKLTSVNVCLGVGASFDFVAGSVARAPEWMQHNGLEWFYRLMKEPGRLWKRYLVEDMKFLPIFLNEFNHTVNKQLHDMNKNVLDKKELRNKL